MSTTPQNGNSLELSLSGEVIFKAFWRGTRNWRLSFSPIVSIFSRLEKIEKKSKRKKKDLKFQISENPSDKPAGFRIKTGFTPVVRNINLENITSKKGKYALFLNGYEHSPITELSITLLTSYLL